MFLLRHGTPDFKPEILGYGQGDPFVKISSYKELIEKKRERTNIEKTVEILHSSGLELSNTIVRSSPAAAAQETLALVVTGLVAKEELKKDPKLEYHKGDYTFPPEAVEDKNLDQRSFGALSLCRNAEEKKKNDEEIRKYRDREYPDDQRPTGKSPDYVEQAPMYKEVNPESNPQDRKREVSGTKEIRLDGREGESFDDVVVRGQNFLKNTLPHLEGKKLLLGSHVGTIEALMEGLGIELEKQLNSKTNKMEPKLKDGQFIMLESLGEKGIMVYYSADIKIDLQQGMNLFV